MRAHILHLDMLAALFQVPSAAALSNNVNAIPAKYDINMNTVVLQMESRQFLSHT